MRTIRHRAHVTVTARSGHDDTGGTLGWIVTVPWDDGPASENHGHHVLPQLVFDVEGPTGDIVEDVTLSAGDTHNLFLALQETYGHIDWREAGAVEDALARGDQLDSGAYI